MLCLFDNSNEWRPKKILFADNETKDNRMQEVFAVGTKRSETFQLAIQHKDAQDANSVQKLTQLLCNPLSL